MRVNKLHDEVYELEGFVSDEELESVLALISNTTEEEWYGDSVTPQYDFWKGKVISVITKEITSINQRIASLFSSEIVPTGINISRYKDGDKIGPHRDNYDDFSGAQGISYGIIIYWNDNYRGGELYYKELNLIYKPKPGSLLLHSGEIEHESLPVIGDGERYFSTAFIRSNNSSRVLLNKDIFKDLE